MKKLLLAVAVMYAGLVAAGSKLPPMWISAPHTTVQLIDEPCVDKDVLKHIKPEYRDRFKRASGTYEGVPSGVCWAWIDDEKDAVFLMWDDGGHFSVEKRLLKIETGT